MQIRLPAQILASDWLSESTGKKERNGTGFVMYADRMIASEK